MQAHARRTHSDSQYFCDFDVAVALHVMQYDDLSDSRLESVQRGVDVNARVNVGRRPLQQLLVQSRDAAFATPCEG